jgi:diacylglycerol kinase family enzyme
MENQQWEENHHAIMVNNFNTVHENTNIMNNNILINQNTLLTLTFQNLQTQQSLREVSSILKNRLENLNIVLNYINDSISQSIINQDI